MVFCPVCYEPAIVCAGYGTCPMSEYSKQYIIPDEQELATRDAEQRDAPAEAGGDWTCIKCKTRNSDDKSICGFCDTPRLGG